MSKKQFTIRKKIAKQGNNTIIVVPKVLQEELSKGTLVKLTIDVLKSK